MRSSIVFSSVLTLLLFFRISSALTESTLVISNAGVESAEDGPFVASDYKFLPGEFVYAVFQIGGFKVNRREDAQENTIRSISLNWQVSALDGDNVPLAEPVSGDIKTELSPEDKNWAPKRRVSFSLPAFVAAGEYHLHIVAKDVSGNVEVSKDLPLEIGGTRIVPSKEIQVQHFRFSRTESGPALELAAYRPGDPVYIRFDMVGFSNTSQNDYDLSYGVTVLRPDGKPFLEQPSAAKLTSAPFYPAKFIPGSMEITTSSSSPRGTYVLILTVRDSIANRTSVTKQSFSLEE